MPAHLVIKDGDPHWWASQDIWVVPGNDPNAPPGSPIAGMNAYLWARVANTGTTAANGGRVDFYWANPAAQIAVGVATQIGSAYVDLAPGETQEVLCLVPWVPVIVNGGHECVLAVAHGPGQRDPLPDPLPNGFSFDPKAHDQIAQRNLSVLAAYIHMPPSAIYVNAPRRADKRARVAVEIGGALDRRALELLGLHGLRPAAAEVVEVGLAREARCGDPDAPMERELEVLVPRGTTLPVFVTVHAAALAHGEYQLVHLVEQVDGKVVGGVSYVVLNAQDKEQQP